MADQTREFYDLKESEQAVLLASLLARITEKGVPDLEALAEQERRSPEEVWVELCDSCGFEPCAIPMQVLREGHARRT
jgi:hypothetical protein